MRTRRPFPDVEETETGVLAGDICAGVDNSSSSSNGSFTPHTAENRKARRAGVATWAPPAPAEGETAAPSRRELLAQRQRARIGTVDPALRRLQREAIRKVKR